MSDLQPFPPTRKRPMKLNTLVTLMVCAIIGSVLLVVFALYSVQITRATRDDVKDTALGIARTLADSPEIKRGLMESPQAGIIQPIAEAVHEAQRPAVYRGHRPAWDPLFPSKRSAVRFAFYWRRSDARPGRERECLR